MTVSNARCGRTVKAVATAAVVGLATTAIAAAGGGPAGAATPIYAQSVGRFLDGSAGGHPIQQVADLHDARATAPGAPTQQNPLHATLLGKADVPFGRHLQQSGGGAFHLGAAQQVAVARDNGFSYGGSGAIANSGGASLGGSNHAYPADATITLSSASLGSTSIPGLPNLPGLPGVPGAPGVPGLPGGSAAALGGVQAQVGAVAALARTQVGGAQTAPRYQIAGLTLTMGSPALGRLLQTLARGGQQFSALLGQLSKALGGKRPPKDCTLTAGTVQSTISMDNGAVVLHPAHGTISVDVALLLRQIGFDLNSLPPNTDLMAFVLNNLGRVLSTGLENVVHGIQSPLQELGAGCLSVLPAPLRTVLGQVYSPLQKGQARLERAVNAVAAKLSSAGAPGLKQLTNALAKAVDIGVNVQQGAYPLASARAPKFAYHSPLAATPDQATSPVPGQGVVRAIELDLGGGQAASVSLGNAAAGPSAPAPAPQRHSVAPSPVPSTNLPTGVPAGAAGGSRGGTPVLPLVALLLGLGVAGSGVLAYRIRGKFSR